MNTDKFLIVDDQPETLSTIRKTLSDSRISQQHCNNTAEAISALSDSQPFAGIIVRLKSRRIDGHAVVRSCRSSEVNSQVSIYVLVEDSELESASEILREGASEILLTPLEPRELRMKCRLTSGRKNQQKQHRVDHSHPIQNQDHHQNQTQQNGHSADAVANIAEAAVDSFWSDSSLPVGEEPEVPSATDLIDVVHRTPLSKLVIPEIDPRSLRFSHGVSEQQLQNWQQDQTVRKVNLDRALLCPECHGLPTFRYGCGNCGGAFHEPETIIHHYACAYIGGESEFRRGHSLTCPKCLQKDLVAGSDFERVAGVFRCSDCNSIGNEPVLIGHCLCCHHRFVANEAFEYTMTGYHVPTSDLEKAPRKKDQRQFHTSHHASQKPPNSSKRRRRRSSSKRVSE